VASALVAFCPPLDFGTEPMRAGARPPLPRRDTELRIRALSPHDENGPARQLTVATPETWLPFAPRGWRGGSKAKAFPSVRRNVR
jgi:hypothetical protein